MTKICVPRDVGRDRALLAPGTGFAPCFRGAPVIALRGEVVTLKIWPPLPFPQIQFQGKMTPRQEKGGFSTGKKFKPHAGGLAAVAGGGTGAAREQAPSSKAKRKVN